ncbi:transaldolase family protein [Nakamurella alba]|nr:transaldolase family protein [Nakamurella alba]
MMSLYVDSAVRDEVEPLLATGLFRGMTTNPTLLHRAGLTGADLPAVYDWAVAAGSREVFVQAWGADAGAIEASGRKLRELGDATVIKVAATGAGLQAAAKLAADGIPVLVTVVYAVHQAVSAAAAGAQFLAPYVGRMADLGLAGREDTLQMHRILQSSGTGARVLAASVRSTADLVALAAGGVDAFALPVPVCRALLHDAHTETAAAAFDALSAEW